MKVNLGVMSMKMYAILLKALESEPHHRMLFNVIPKTPVFQKALTLKRKIQSAYSQPHWLGVFKYYLLIFHFFSDFVFLLFQYVRERETYKKIAHIPSTFGKGMNVFPHPLQSWVSSLTELPLQLRRKKKTINSESSSWVPGTVRSCLQRRLGNSYNRISHPGL